MQTNEQNQVYTDLDIKYGEIETVPFPVGAKPKKNLGNAFVVSNDKFFFERFAVMNLQGELITGFILKKSTFGKVKCFGIHSILLPQGNAWTVCDFSGKSFNGNSYENVVELQNSYLAVGQKNAQTRKTLYALADMCGNPKTSFDYIKINAFSDGFAVAQRKEKVDVFNAAGKIAFSLDCDEMRNFCNGYAVFRKNGRMGAVDATGRVTLQPKFHWLRDCECGRFYYCNVANPKAIDDIGIVDATGIVDANGNIILDVSKGLRGLMILNENTVLHRVMYVYEKTDGNERTVYHVPATGFVIGNKIIEAKFLFIGEEGEGLRAFAAYTQSSDTLHPYTLVSSGRFTIGYMDSGFNTVFTIVDYNTKTSIGFNELRRYADSKHLSPFINGTAVVEVQQGEDCSDHSLLKAFWGAKTRPQPYVIDKKGHRVTDATVAKARLSLHASGGKPTANDSNSFDSLKAGISKNKIKKEKNMRKKIENTLRKKGFSVAFLFIRSECKQLGENIWMVKDRDEERVVLSRLESLIDDYYGGYSCGLLGVQAASGLFGFVNENLDVAVEPVYKKISQFIDNAAWAMRDEQWFILKRTCELLPRPRSVQTLPASD
jgi:hypothetical protein